MMLLVHYNGGPYDGAREHLDTDALGLQDSEPIKLASLTPQCRHIYQCDYWAGDWHDEVDVYHDAADVRRRQTA